MSEMQKINNLSESLVKINLDLTGVKEMFTSRDFGFKRLQLKLDNDYIFSIVQGSDAYCCEDDEYEIACMNEEGILKDFLGFDNWDTVLGYQDQEEVNKWLEKAKKLKQG